MRKLTKRVIVCIYAGTLFLLTSCSSAAKSSPPHSAGVYTLPLPTDISAESFTGVDHLLADKKIVQLGEGIHMTREFPAVRIPLARRLFEKHSFDMILFEGSAVDAWLASDKILNTARPFKDLYKEARDIAFFPLWRSPEYNEVFATPFYVASYDLQPGMGKLKASTISEFLSAVAKYHAPPRDLQKLNKILTLLCDRQNGFPNQLVTSKGQLQAAISKLDTWFKQAAKVIEPKYPNSPHGRMLRMIPVMLKNQLTLWEAHQADSERKNFKTFQETRDRLGADHILRIASEVSKSGKVIVWAHHVHVFHNVSRLSRHSLGSDLKAELGNKLYTVGLFANTGEVYALGNVEEITEGPIRPGSEYGLESHLVELAKGNDIFVDFGEVRRSSEAKWLGEQGTTRVEGADTAKTIPSKDFDAAIFIQKVSKPELPRSQKD